MSQEQAQQPQQQQPQTVQEFFDKWANVLQDSSKKARLAEEFAKEFGGEKVQTEIMVSANVTNVINGMLNDLSRIPSVGAELSAGQEPQEIPAGDEVEAVEAEAVTAE